MIIGINQHHQITIMKKKITYIEFLLYISLPVGMFVFRLGDNISINPIINTIIALALIPVSSIIVFCAFLVVKWGPLLERLLRLRWQY